MRRLPILLVLCLAAPLGADVTACACDITKPETLEARECALCREAGKQLQGIETARFVEVDGPAQIPVPEGGTGLWVHPQGSKLHVHLTEQITETVLLR